MKTLLIDIETSPNLGYFWGLWNQNISPKNIKATGRTLCWSAKWRKKKGTMFDSVFHSSEKHMLERVWNLLDEADAVVHFNGQRFDIPTLQKEFLIHKMLPPSPYKQIDLIKTVRQQFRFHSNKLDSVLKTLGMETKIQNKGMELWIECLANDPKAWAAMKRYNKRDTVILEALYERLLPWISSHPNAALYLKTEDRPACPNCGGTEMEKRGLARTNTQQYQRYQCKGCGKWSRERFNCTPPEKKHTVLQGIHN